MIRIMFVCSLIGAFMLATARAQDRIELPRTSIIGNRELPKILYIVPWKRPNADMLMGSPVAGLVGEALDPVDRDVFLREVAYYDYIIRSKPTQR